ncbi:MAG TPA: hypothetical protein VL096_12400 [Pirellulaceae bacterium]|nr:hypothetical protein [Pirellulaceae bacterium]
METSTSNAQLKPTTPAEPGTVPPIISRIDPPHPLGELASREAVAAPPVIASPAVQESSSDEDAAALDEIVFATTGRSQEHLAEQLHAQALQLADHLRTKQREIDRREALLNAREAKLENELRHARLWVREREQETQEREQQFQLRLQELNAKSSQLASVEISVDHDLTTQQAQFALREQALAQREEKLSAEQQRLDNQRSALRTAEARLEQQRAKLAADQQRARQKHDAWQAEAAVTLEKQLRNIERARQEVEAREEQLAQRRAPAAQQREHREWEARLLTRQHALDEAEKLLASHGEQLDRDRAFVAAERVKIAHEAQTERRELAHWQQRERAELTARKEQLAVATEVIEKHRAAAEQLRAEAARMQREAIEMRLVSEQLWLELSQHAPPAELTQSLALLRKRLAENQRGAKEHAAEQKAELVRLATRLDEQQQKIVEQREHLQAWVAIQQQEIESQAASLVRREQELDQQEQTLKRERDQATKDRRELQQEVRRLLGRVRQLETQPVAN